MGHQEREVLQSAAEECLLNIEKTKVWCDHLTTVMQNRRRGTIKAAATMADKKGAKTENLTHIMGFCKEC